MNVAHRIGGADFSSTYLLTWRSETWRRHHLGYLASIYVFCLFFQSGLVIGEVTCSFKLEGTIFPELVKPTFKGIQGGCYDNTCRQ